MKEMADDLTRKRSAFWNCQVDAFLCPVCAFVYALSPLGFQMYANKFVFMNLNENISVLVDVNGKKRGNGLKEKGEEENYTVWFARILNKVLSDKVKENIAASIPMGSMGTTEDVAKAAAFLASDGARYITGQVLRVDGGMAM